MDKTDAHCLSAALRKLARKAGEAIMTVYLRGGAVQNKSDDSPLTEADLAAHRVLMHGLTALTPMIPVVSEEDPASHPHRRPDSTFWLIDPLDGTKEFIARNGEFTVNIALVHDAYPILGVVFAPALNLLYWNESDNSAFSEDASGIKSIRTSGPVSGQPARVVASKSHLDERTRAFIDALGPHELVQAGSSLKFCRVAEGSADVYPRLAPTCEWDTAAAQAIVEAAGGTVRTLDGARLAYGKPDVLNPFFVARGA